MRHTTLIAAAALAGGLIGPGGSSSARADCASDVRMLVAEIAEVEAAVPLAENPDLTLAPDTGDEPDGGGAGLGKDIVPDQDALTGQSTEGFVPGPAEEPVAASDDPQAGLVGEPAATNKAAGELARAKLTVDKAEAARADGDAAACAGHVEEAKGFIRQAREAIEAAGKGQSPQQSAPMPADDVPSAPPGADAPKTSTDAPGTSTDAPKN